MKYYHIKEDLCYEINEQKDREIERVVTKERESDDKRMREW